MKSSKFIIGNSSVGIRESEVFGIPTIDLGTRQQNRTKNKNISHITLEKNKILKSITEISQKSFESDSSFGDDHNTVEEFYEILSGKKIWDFSLQKQFIDRNP